MDNEKITENNPAVNNETAAAALSLQIEALQKQYSIEKALLNERARIKEEEIKSIKAQVAEREQSLRTDFRKKEDEIGALMRKIIELEGKVALEQALSTEKIKAREDEIRELKLRFEQRENKLKEEVESALYKSSLREEESGRLSRLIAEREIALNSQIQWKQQELLLERARFEEELRKISIELDAEEKRIQQEINSKNSEIEALKSKLSAEIIEYKVKYEEEQMRGQRLLVRLEEIQKERLNNQVSFESLIRQIDEMRNENRSLREVAYLPENVAKLRFMDAQGEIGNLMLQIVALKDSIGREKDAREIELAKKDNEVEALKSQIEKLGKDLAHGSYEKLVLLQREKEALEVKLDNFNADKEREAARQTKLLSEKEEMYTYFIDDLARGFVHKIRNMLGVINGAVEIGNGLLEESNKKFQPSGKLADKLTGKNKIYTEINGIMGQFKENFDMATQHVADMLKTFDEFRELTKPLVMEKQDVQINNMMNKICSAALIKERARKQNVQISEEYAPELPVISADAAKLETVFTEIVLNALDALAKGGSLKVQTILDGENNMAAVRIADTGIGIPETQVGKVFQPFFTNKSNRHGVGLPKAKRIITLHNGTTGLESEKGKGTTLIIKLPLKV